MTAEPRPRPTAPAGPPPGLRVDGYELLARIGEGGMGVVHLARRPGSPRVALKVLRPHIIGGEEARLRLEREVNSLSRIRSRHIAEIVDADPWGPIPYVATRYVPGLALHDHVRVEGPITGADLDHFARCLADAVAAVHAHGVLHRDIKPSNVLMEGRSPILIDFGLARVADDPRLTHTGWLLGTPGYLAPEILYGDDASAASDIHSLAATIALAGTANAPFGRGPAVAVMDRVRRGEYVLDGLPPRMRSLVVACLAPDPAARPTLPELQQALALPESPLTARVALDDPEDVFTTPLALAALAGTAEPTWVDEVETDDEDDWDRSDSDEWDEWDEPQWEAWEDRADTAEFWPEVPAAHQPGVTTPYSTVAPSTYPSHPLDRPEAPVLPAPQRARRTMLFVLLTATVGALIAAVPYVMTLAAVLLAWMLRSGSLATEAASNRRLLRGRPSWTDGPRLLLGAPWHLLRSIAGTVLLVLWAVGVATALWLLAFAFSLSVPQTLLLCGATFAAGLGLGPGGRRVRGPLGRVFTPISAEPSRWAIAAAVIAVVGAFAAYVAFTSGPDWTPDNDRPFANTTFSRILI